LESSSRRWRGDFARFRNVGPYAGLDSAADDAADTNQSNDLAVLVSNAKTFTARRVVNHITARASASRMKKILIERSGVVMSHMRRVAKSVGLVFFCVALVAIDAFGGTNAAQPKPSTVLKIQPSTLNIQPSTLQVEPTTRNIPPSTPIPSSTLNIAPSTIQAPSTTRNIAPSTLQVDPSTLTIAPPTRIPTTTLQVPSSTLTNPPITEPAGPPQPNP
jgi:hypothetical protein